MISTVIGFCNKAILYGFYALFFLVPLTFTGSTYELFEFNKMWLVFGITLFMTTIWLLKMILQGRIVLQRTPLDIPILLFVASQIISTIFSMEPHVSLWGYYSRFNGGLLSILSYVMLYYLFVSNYKDLQENVGTKTFSYTQRSMIFLISLLLIFGGVFFTAVADHFSIMVLFVLLGFAAATFAVAGTIVQRILTFSLISASVVALWGLPSHFGYDPTCLLFRGTLDVSCWTDAFQPKIRIFSTFGQPNWMAAFLAITLSITIGHLLQNNNNEQSISIKKFSSLGALFTNQALQQHFLRLAPLLGLTLILYLCLLFTGSQSGFAAFAVAMLLFAIPFFKPNLFNIKLNKAKPFYQTIHGQILIGLSVIFFLLAFFLGSPIRALEKFTYPSLKEQLLTKKAPTPQNTPAFAEELGGTDSGAIRKIVWNGAINIWKSHPLIGSGVETFAYSYYRHRPTAHNLTSEWDYLYNKAHNEYLNFLATTGLLGLGTYLAMIGLFIWITIKTLIQKKSSESWIVLGLLAGYITILVSNFLGFSVVVVNIYFFLIPALVLFILGKIDTKKTIEASLVSNLSFLTKAIRGISTTLLLGIGFYLLFLLVRFWQADTHFAKGYNYDRAGEYQMGYTELRTAITMRPEEPNFQDEYSYNTAVLATALAGDDQATAAATFAEESERVSDYVVANHPNNVVFWKTRVRTFYALSQVDNKYLEKALNAIKKAAELAPTDAKVSYNLGILYGQNGKIDEAITTLNHTIQLKPDYVDAWYALGLYYREKATDGKGKVMDNDDNKKAIETMQYIVKTFSPLQSEKAQEALTAWNIN